MVTDAQITAFYRRVRRYWLSDSRSFMQAVFAAESNTHGYAYVWAIGQAGSDVYAAMQKRGMV